MKTIQALFDDYQTLIPADAGPTQRRECLRAFMCGMKSFQGVNFNIAGMNEEQAMAHLTNIDLELTHYFMKVLGTQQELEMAAAPDKRGLNNGQ